ncbi:MAG: glycerol-3-phosphate 1-O-acyltransferase PlsY [Armatimonadetes bacterium]|nr:glycerol-3-phosphate 1-O-acyltransferase PlsY [Armatimonadota bacterium]
MLFALFAFAYVLGAIPFGVIVARASGVDIMTTGSGNIGATNVHRTLGAGKSIPVFLLDVGKGFVPSFIALTSFGRSDLAFLVGLTAVLGHCLSIFLKFKGGKGVATGLGVLIGSVPPVAGLAFSIFVVVLAVTRYLSLGSIIASLALVPLGLAFHEPLAVNVCLGCLTLFVVLRHRKNIERLRSGNEPKFFLKGAPQTAAVEGPPEPLQSQTKSEEVVPFSG